MRRLTIAAASFAALLAFVSTDSAQSNGGTAGLSFTRTVSANGKVATYTVKNRSARLMGKGKYLAFSASYVVAKPFDHGQLPWPMLSPRRLKCKTTLSYKALCFVALPQLRPGGIFRFKATYSPPATARICHGAAFATPSGPILATLDKVKCYQS